MSDKKPSKIKNFAKAIKKRISSGVQNVTFEEFVERLSVCKICEYQKNGECQDCGCILHIKAWWKSEDCPKNKWDKQ